METIECIALTIHVDLLAQFDELHLGGHVAHGPHALRHVLVVEVAILVVVKLFKGICQL